MPKTAYGYTDIMITEIVATGKTVNEAIEELKKKLGVEDLDDVEYKVVSVGKKGGLFGLGATPAKVMAFVDDGIEEPKKAEPEKVAPVKTETVKSAPVAKPQEQNTRNDRAAKNDRPARNDRPAKTGEQSAPKPKKPKTPSTEAEVKAAASFVDCVVRNLEINVTTSVGTDNDNNSCISIAGEDAGMLIGHHGDTLDALQYLANLAANLADGKDDHERITVDVEGYREKREETLRALARRMAEKVQKYGKSVVLEPMNPYERRIIHSEVQEIEGVSTNSIGSDNNRKVVIFLTANGMGRLPMRNDRRRNDNRRPRTRTDFAPAKEAPAAEESEASDAE